MAAPGTQAASSTQAFGGTLHHGIAIDPGSDLVR